MQLGLLLAFVCALMSVLGFLLKHRGAVAAPPVQWRHPVGSTVALFKSPIYTLGCIVATTSWGFHVGALALAPISIVQTVIAGGLVLVTVLADRLFGYDVSRREWIGVACCAAGLAFLAATLEGTADSAHADYGGWELAAFVGGATVLGCVIAWLRGTSSPTSERMRITNANGCTITSAPRSLVFPLSALIVMSEPAHSRPAETASAGPLVPRSHAITHPSTVAPPTNAASSQPP